MTRSPPSSFKRSKGGKVLFAVCLLVLLAACKIELNSNLDEQEANEMLAVLLANGIVASKVIEKDKVILTVEESQFGDAVEVMKAHGLPRTKFSNTGDLFTGEGLVASPVQEWARFNFAKSQELSQSIASIPGVVKVDVHVAATRRENPFEDPKPPSASVLVLMQEDRITDNLIPQIKQLISFSIPDISYDRVGVVVAKVPPPRAPQTLVSFGGMIVHQGSAQAVQILSVVAGLATVVAVGLGTFVFLQRKAGLKARAGR
ncbi:MAG: type III secretion system inner membrane ring lipoprotein SctJ [Paracoccaceae bacterium]